VPNVPKSPKPLDDGDREGHFGNNDNFGTGVRYPDSRQEDRGADYQFNPTGRENVAIECVPEVYARAFAAIQTNRPADVPGERWEHFTNDAGLFLDRFGQEAERLGWRADELFGLHPTAPLARYDCMGLLWMLRGEHVTELTDKLARLSDGLSYCRRPGKDSHAAPCHRESLSTPAAIPDF
jgi:hypothetical protein